MLFGAVRRGDHGSGGGSCTGSGRITGSKWFRSWPGGSAIFKAGASNGSLWGFGSVHSVWPGTWLSSICSMGRSCKGSASGVSSSCWDSPIQDASSWEQVLQGTLAAPEPALMVGSIEPSYSTTVSPPISPQHPVLGGGAENTPRSHKPGPPEPGVQHRRTPANTTPPPAPQPS